MDSTSSFEQTVIDPLLHQHINTLLNHEAYRRCHIVFCPELNSNVAYASILCRTVAHARVKYFVSDDKTGVCGIWTTHNLKEVGANNLFNRLERHNLVFADAKTFVCRAGNSKFHLDQLRCQLLSLMYVPSKSQNQHIEPTYTISGKESGPDDAAISTIMLESVIQKCLTDPKMRSWARDNALRL